MEDAKFNLQFITHQTAQYDTLAAAVEALKGGCRWVQLRMKEATIEEITPVANQLKALCKVYGAKLIIDDHISVALAIKADGVHLGKNDLSIVEARRILGSDYIIGGTANTFEDIKQLVEDGVDYVGLGPFRFTETKQNLSAILGLAGYEHILKQCNEANIVIPIVAIGGITANDIPFLQQIGVNAVALSSTILQASSPAEETKRILSILNHSTN